MDHCAKQQMLVNLTISGLSGVKKNERKLVLPWKLELIERKRRPFYRL